MKTPLFSVIIPAHNEEQYIEKCIASVKRAARQVRPFPVQAIVVANRCTDRTAELAKACGAYVLENDDNSLSRIRNAGAAIAAGKILVTLDADSRMSDSSLSEILEFVQSGKYVGGGAVPRFDRNSLGIIATEFYILAHLLPEMIREKALLSGGMFWCRKDDFDAIGGFNPELVSMEDMDFAKRLNRLGRSRGQKYGTLKHSYIVTSARKFDEFGDWYLLQNRELTKAIFTGRNREAADHFYYEARSKK